MRFDAPPTTGGPSVGQALLKPLWAGAFALHFRPEAGAGEGPEAVQAWARAIAQAKGAAQAQGAQELQCRIGAVQGAIAEALKAQGFGLRAERVEYEAPPEAWPDEVGSPLVWSPMPSMDPGVLASTAAFIRAVAEGDPDLDPSEDTLALLTDYLTDRAFDSGPDAVQVGALGEALAALVIAQVREADGWGRITYMGLLPAFRGQGLGAWVHRHGFAMLKAQGATSYRGGTLAQNAPMRRLFVAHGCQEVAALQEWALRLD